jgi:preprotein translocase subunit SecA
MAALSSGLHAMGIDGAGTSEDELWDVGGRDAILGHLRDLVAEQLEAREREHGEETWSFVERIVLLRTIDSLWVEHLTEVDDMRRGIGLRGYAQQDPLNEFRREAFRLYEELRDLIRHHVATTIFRVTVQQQAAVPEGAQPLPGPGQPGQGAQPAANGASADPAAAAVATATAGSGVAASFRQGPAPATVGGVPRPIAPAAAAGPAVAGVRPGFTPDGQRIGRNDPCWCGSGLKYKKCHGR